MRGLDEASAMARRRGERYDRVQHISTDLLVDLDGDTRAGAHEPLGRPRPPGRALRGRPRPPLRRRAHAGRLAPDARARRRDLARGGGRRRLTPANCDQTVSRPGCAAAMRTGSRRCARHWRATPHRELGRSGHPRVVVRFRGSGEGVTRVSGAMRPLLGSPPQRASSNSPIVIETPGRVCGYARWRSPARERRETADCEVDARGDPRGQNRRSQRGRVWSGASKGAHEGASPS